MSAVDTGGVGNVEGVGNVGEESFQPNTELKLAHSTRPA